MSDEQKIPELEKQNAKFGYKAPESVYQKHDPKATLVGSGMFREIYDVKTALLCC